MTSTNTPWADALGDVWDVNPDNTLTACGYPEGELQNWKREDVERVWGPLSPFTEETPRYRDMDGDTWESRTNVPFTRANAAHHLTQITGGAR